MPRLTRTKSLFTCLIVLCGFKLLTVALPLMNKPSSAAFYLGVLLLFTALAGTFTAVQLLWRRS